jgi:hypothetical protein
MARVFTEHGELDAFLFGDGFSAVFGFHQFAIINHSGDIVAFGLFRFKVNKFVHRFVRLANFSCAGFYMDAVLWHFEPPELWRQSLRFDLLVVLKQIIQNFATDLDPVFVVGMRVNDC